VETDVEKSEETKHAAEADEVMKFEKFAQSSNAKGKDKKAEAPIACGMLQELHGIRAKLALEDAPEQPCKRRQAKQKYRDFGPLAYKKRAHAEIQR
jgi:hypothetical protein